MSFLERFKGRTSLSGKDIANAIMETKISKKVDLNLFKNYDNNQFSD